ncbi:hypothetical protein Tco_0128529 [Tanacetum coccineum]
MPTALAGSHGAKAYGASSGVVGDEFFWAVTMARSHGAAVPLPLRTSLHGSFWSIPQSIPECIRTILQTCTEKEHSKNKLVLCPTRSLKGHRSSLNDSISSNLGGIVQVKIQLMMKYGNQKHVFHDAENEAAYGAEESDVGRKSPSVESVDSSGEEEQRIAKRGQDVKCNTFKLLWKMKQAMHERGFKIARTVKLRRDLRSALEVGLSMSLGRLLAPRNMDSKRAELEEIALAEADLRNKRVFQQDFDSKIAFINHERKQRSEETSLGAELRNNKGQSLMNGNTSRQPSRKHFLDSPSLSDSKSTEVNDYPRNNPLAASSTLVELTTRLDFFKERRSLPAPTSPPPPFAYGTTSQP